MRFSAVLLYSRFTSAHNMRDASRLKVSRLESGHSVILSLGIVHKCSLVIHGSDFRY